MRTKTFVFTVALFLFVGFSYYSDSYSVELARVGDKVITSEQFLEEWRYATPSQEAPKRTLEGKKEFLDRMISKLLLSGYIRSRGWDTLSGWNNVLEEYESSLYLQSLYRDALPQAREPWRSDPLTLMALGRKFVDSLYAAYDVKIEEKTVIFIADKTIGLLKTASANKLNRPIFRWSQVFTDEEKKLPAATFTGGQFTVGEFAAEVDKMPSFTRPTAGNSDEIVATLEHLARQWIFRVEFEKRNLRQQPWFVERMTNKREELVASEMFAQMTDTSTVSQDEVRKYYEDHKDDFISVTLIKVATITLDSLSVAENAAKRIADGRPFESVAVDLSIYSSSPTGFDTTGLVDRRQLPEIYDAIWDKQIGEVVGPIREKQVTGREVWKIAKLLGRENPRLLSLEEATPMVLERLKQLKADEGLVRLLSELRSKEDVKIDYEALEKLELPSAPQPRE